MRGVHRLAGWSRRSALRGRAGITVLLADDQALVRTGFSLILGAESDMEIVGEAGDGLHAVRLAAERQPAVVLMDVRMPDLDGNEATERITTASPATRALTLTTFDLYQASLQVSRVYARTPTRLPIDRQFARES